MRELTKDHTEAIQRVPEAASSKHEEALEKTGVLSLSSNSYGRKAVRVQV